MTKNQVLHVLCCNYATCTVNTNRYGTARFKLDTLVKLSRVYDLEF